HHRDDRDHRAHGADGVSPYVRAGPLRGGDTVATMPLWLLHDPPLGAERLRPEGPFEAAWSIHPSVIIGTALLAGLYFWGIGPARRRWSLGPPAGPWRILAFVLS